jgi:glutathione S-transferase
LWAIEELGLDCELIMLPFPPRARAKHFLAVNPLGTIPAFLDGDAVMTESSAIVHYLATRRGPSDLAVRIEEPDYPMYLDFLHHADATLTFPQTVYIRFALMEKNRSLEEAGRAYAEWFAARLIKVATRIQQCDYLCSNRFTGADIAVGYALFLATLNGLSHLLSPVLRGYLDRLMARPQFQRARERERRAAAEQGVGVP